MVRATPSAVRSLSCGKSSIWSLTSHASASASTLAMRLLQVSPSPSGLLSEEIISHRRTCSHFDALSSLCLEPSVTNRSEATLNQLSMVVYVYSLRSSGFSEFSALSIFQSEISLRRIPAVHDFVGYDLKSEEGYENMKTEFDRVVGHDYLRAVHLNDSKG